MAGQPSYGPCQRTLRGEEQPGAAQRLFRRGLLGDEVGQVQAATLRARAPSLSPETSVRVTYAQSYSLEGVPFPDRTFLLQLATGC